MESLRPEQSLSLRQWFTRNARLPLLISILAIFGVEILLLGMIGKHQRELQNGVANRLAELSRLALRQGSTPLLQAGLDIAVRELRASQAFVCEQGLIFALKSPELSRCAIEPRFGYRIVKVPIPFEVTNQLRPNRQFEFILQVPLLPQESLIYYTLALSILVCVSGAVLLRRVGSRMEQDLFMPLFKNLSGHLHLPISELEIIRQRLLQLNQLRTQEAVASALMARNVQVAHDIKSPLTALLFASKDFDLLPMTSRKVIRAAVMRISAIADSLNESKEKKNKSADKCLNDLMEELILEKKVEYQKLNDVVWISEMSKLEKNTPTPVESELLKRVLSNLINNAIESLKETRGTIRLGAHRHDSMLQIWVQDSGQGFPPELVSQVGTVGMTQGKTFGRGLGLSHAYEVTKASKGTLRVESVVPHGTRVVLSF